LFNKNSANMNHGARDDRPRISKCPMCSHHFAKCCLCVMPLTIPNTFSEDDHHKRPNKVYFLFIIIILINKYIKIDNKKKKVKLKK